MPVDHSEMYLFAMPVNHKLIPILLLFSAVLWSGCDFMAAAFSTCPGDFPDHFPMAAGQSYTYAYEMTQGGGLASGEDRGYGTVIWRVEAPVNCSGEGLSARISTESTIITENRTFTGDDQSWRRRDSTHTSRTFQAHYSADKGLYGFMAEPIAPDEFLTAPDTLRVMEGDGAFQESVTRTFVRGVGMVRHSHWKRFGLGGGSQTVTIELAKDER